MEVRLGRRRREPEYVESSTGCWLWLGARNTDGYGLITRSTGRGTKVTASAHRVYYTRHRGEIPAGMVIDHLCGNSGCVNPDHMDVTTQLENQRRGKKSGFTDAEVAVIRQLVADGMSQRKVAKLYGCSQPTISYIVRGINHPERAKPHNSMPVHEVFLR